VHAGRVKRLRVPAVLAFALVGCGGDKPPADANTACSVLCIPDGTDAGVCPSSPYACVSAQEHTCPAGCVCTAYCFPRTPQGEMNCPTASGLMCAAPDRTCPDGCDPVA
jgi:hypothetical protein